MHFLVFTLSQPVLNEMQKILIAIKIGHVRRINGMKKGYWE